MSAALEARWESRLDAWAEYMHSKEKGGKVKISSAYRLGARGAPGDGDGIPIHVGEAIDTDGLFRKLASHLRQAVWVWYCEQGSPGDKAQALSVHVNTLRARVRAAKYGLEDLHIARRSSKTKSHFTAVRKV